MQETVIDFIRHGEPQGGNRYRGNTIDDPLSEKGWQQMWQAVGESFQWQYIISSPMQRCSAFAAALAQRDQVGVHIDERLKEIGFGVWEGKTRTEVQHEDREAYQSFYNDPVHCRPAGAESLEDFMRRVSTAYEEIVMQQVGGHCLVVAHAGVIRAVISYVLQAGAASMYRIRVDNAGITRIRHGQFGSVLERMNFAM